MLQLKTLTARVTALPIFVLSLVFQILAAVCLHIWLRSEWMTMVEQIDGWEGYTLGELFGLVFFIIFSASGFSLCFTIFQQIHRKLSSSSSSFLHYGLLTLSFGYLAAVMAIGIYWTRHLAPCVFIFCQNTATHSWEKSTDLPSYALGFRATIGMPFLITGFALSCSLVFGQIQHYRNSHFLRTYSNFRKTSPTISNGNGEPLLNSADDIDFVNAMPANLMLKRYTPYNTHLLSSSPSQTMLADSSDKDKLFPQRVKIWVFFSIFLLFALTWFGLTTYIPNSWQQYHPANLAASARKTVPPSPNDGTLCRDPSYMCPEHNDASFTTGTLKLSDNWYLKFFPSNTIFYLFIILFPLCAILSKHTHPLLSAFFAYKVRIPRPWNSTPRDRIAFFTVGELSALFMTCTFTYLFFHYWYFDHNFISRWPYRTPSSKHHISTVLARSLGQVAVFLFSLLMFPASRNSPLLAMVGVSWEASIQYHRWLGTAFFVAVMGHMFSTYWWYWKEGSLKSIVQIPTHVPNGVDNFTIPMISLLTWTMIITIGGFAIAWQQFRRKHFNLFMFFHHFTYLTLIPGILWHAQASWEYILPAVTIWFFDRLVRAYRSVRAVNLITAAQANTAHVQENKINVFSQTSIVNRYITPPPISSIHQYGFKKLSSLDNDYQSTTSLDSSSSNYLAQSASSETSVSGYGPITNVSGPGVRIIDRGEAGTYIELRILNDNMVYFPGHYAFLNIAEISLFEWHPFTIASPAHFCARSEIVFVIKTMGKNTWTESLYNYIKDYYHQLDASVTDDFIDVPLTVSLDGPYGTPIDFSTYDVIVLLGGGIGITPCKSVYESLMLSYLHDFKARLEFTQDDNLSNGNKRIHLMWSSRDPSLFDLMSESLSQIPYGPFSAQLFCDNPYLKSLQDSSHFSVNSNDSNSNVNQDVDEELIAKNKNIITPHMLSLVRAGRPDLEQEISTVVFDAGKDALLLDERHHRRVLVFVCGPGPMAQDAEEICQRRGWDFHTETFTL